MMEITMAEVDDNETRRDWKVVQEDAGKSVTDRLRVMDGYLYRTILENGQVAMVFVKALELRGSKS
jgi:hypothetical protein